MLESKSMEEFSLIPMKGLRADEVTEVNLSQKGLGDAEARVIGSLLTVNTSLTKLSVAGNKLGNEGAQAIGSALKESKVSKLKELDIQYNGIGPDGAKVIAAFCAVSASLTKLNVNCNILGDKGEAALREAVAGREGFHLQICESWSVGRPVDSDVEDDSRRDGVVVVRR